MRQQSRSAGPAAHALCVLALFALASLAQAAPKPAQPVFVPDDLKAVPSHLALTSFGLGLTPRTGPLSSLAVVYSGEHYRVRAWDLTGPLTAHDSRIHCGAVALLGSGFKTDGTAALSARAAHLAGHHFNCWVIQDLDRFRPIPENWLRLIKHDGEGIPEAD